MIFRFMISRFRFFVSWLRLMIRRFRSMIFRCVICRLGFLISRFGLVIDRLRLMIHWFWFLVGRFGCVIFRLGLMISGFWCIVQFVRFWVVMMAVHVIFVRIVLMHGQTKDHFQAERMTVKVVVRRSFIDGFRRNVIILRTTIFGMKAKDFF